jgi:hypothetical protein
LNTFNLRESALLISALFSFDRSQFHSTVSLSSYANQRLVYNDKFCYGQQTPRFRVQGSLQNLHKKEGLYDRPLDIHTSLMKKDSKYLVLDIYMCD